MENDKVREPKPSKCFLAGKIRQKTVVPSSNTGNAIKPERLTNLNDQNHLSHQYELASTSLLRMFVPNSSSGRYVMLAVVIITSPFMWQFLVGFFGACLILVAVNNAFPLTNVFHEAIGTVELSVKLLDGRVNSDKADIEYRIRISCNQTNIDTWQTFEDFCALRQMLGREDLPDIDSMNDNSMKYTDPNYLVNRKEKLRKFLTAVTSNPDLLQHPEVQYFLGLPMLPKMQDTFDYNQNWGGSIENFLQPHSNFCRNNNSKRYSVVGNIESKAEKLRNVWWDQAFSDQPNDIKDFFLDMGNENSFELRGESYMDDKLKCCTGAAAMVLVHADIFHLTNTCYHIASKGKCAARRETFQNIFIKKGLVPPFLFILNIQIPGDPLVSVVLWWALLSDIHDSLDLSPKKNEKNNEENVQNLDKPDTSDKKFEYMLGKYAEIPGCNFCGLEREERIITKKNKSNEDVSYPDGILPSDDFRNERFKLLPSIVEGPFIVRGAVGKKPALLGRKLIQRYFRGNHYIETDLDIASSSVAARIVGLCRGVSSSLTVDLGVTIEGRSKEELPERCLGVVRISKLDLSYAESLYQDQRFSGR